MSNITLITGGAKSGKSSAAVARFTAFDDVTFIATMRPFDEETSRKIKAHQDSRPQNWHLFEGTYDLADAVEKDGHYILDCVTLLVSNILLDLSSGDSPDPDICALAGEKAKGELSRLIDKIRERGADLVLVTNEVGDGIVPENSLARAYRDLLGTVNCALAAMCDEVILSVCGIPLKIK